jgi:hypothetical protein
LIKALKLPELNNRAVIAGVPKLANAEGVKSSAISRMI